MKSSKTWPIIWGTDWKRFEQTFLLTLYYRTLEAASEKFQQKESSYIADIKSLEDKLADVSKFTKDNYVELWISKAKNRAETAEKMVVTLEETIDELEGKLKQLELKHFAHLTLTQHDYTHFRWGPHS